MSGNASISQSSSSIPIPGTVVTTRSERISLRASSHSFLDNWGKSLRQDHTGLYLFILLLTAVSACNIIQAWNPPFKFRLDTVTDRAVACKTAFTILNPQGKDIEIEKAKLAAPHVFVNDAQPLISLRDALWNDVAGLVNSQTYDHLDEPGKARWYRFLKTGEKDDAPAEAAATFDVFVAYFQDDVNFDRLKNKLQTVFTPFEIHGILRTLPFGPERGSQEKILVYRKGDPPADAVEVKVSDALIRDGRVLRNALAKAFDNTTISDQLFNWIQPQLKDTLTSDPAATTAVQNKAAAKVEDVLQSFIPGQIIVDADVVLTKTEINRLYTEYQATLKNRSSLNKIIRYTSFVLLFFLILVITGAFVRRLERRRPHSLKAFMTLMFGFVAAVGAAEFMQTTSYTNTEWEILPLLFFVMLVAITYSWELATIVAVVLTLFIVAGRGATLGYFILLLSVSVGSTVQLGRLRSRKKLVLVGMISGFIGAVLTINIGVLGGRTLDNTLFLEASANFCWAVGAGVAVTAVLPFVERSFGILTDMYLLELGDLSQPLLLHLIQTAPATYGHSMQVGMIAENAAEAIGCRALMTRVGAYYHDIGKIMKPEYYSENQGGLDNIHDHIEPQVSTLVLIAHVKDGVDIAKKHGLPNPIIDMIEQHHGTSLVSFFYTKANKNAEEKAEESMFRYPGPKPRTKEAAILMIADTCESACRSLGMGVAPNKVEAMVHRLIKMKFDDQQFDDSCLTINELKAIEKSVVKSIVASMHGRIQYPEPAAKTKCAEQQDHAV